MKFDLRSWGVFSLTVISLNTYADTQPEFLKQLTGCFSASYFFIDDKVDGTYIEPKPEKKEPIVEWLKMEEKGNTYTLSHHVWRPGDEKPSSHFSEVWEKTSGNTWTQKIVSFGATRYECEMETKTINEFGGQKFTSLECKQPKKPAPKPNRDKARTDYEKIVRGHHINIGPNIWTQQEFNHKVISTDAGGWNHVSSDVGIVVYKRLPEAQCEKIKTGKP